MTSSCSGLSEELGRKTWHAGQPEGCPTSNRDSSKCQKVQSTLHRLQKTAQVGIKRPGSLNQGIWLNIHSGEEDLGLEETTSSVCLKLSKDHKSVGSEVLVLPIPPPPHTHTYTYKTCSHLPEEDARTKMLGLLKAAQLCCVPTTPEASLESKLLYKAPTSPNSCQIIIIPPRPAWDHHRGQLGQARGNIHGDSTHHASDNAIGIGAWDSGQVHA